MLTFLIQQENNTTVYKEQLILKGFRDIIKDKWAYWSRCLLVARFIFTFQECVTHFYEYKLIVFYYMGIE